MSKRKRATLTDLLNELTFKTIYDKYKMLALSRYKWDGLPEDIETRHIENLLYTHGKALFFRDPEMSYMCLRGDPTGTYNVNHDPLKWRATGHGYSKEYAAENCVVIDNNIIRMPTDNLIMFYVNKLTEAERTMDVNVKAVKTPIIFACDDKDTLTFKRLFQMVDGNTPAIFADKGLNLDAISAFDTKATFLGNELMDYKKCVENELLTVLGFNNLPVDKKERTIVPEVNSNNQLIATFSDLELKSRKEAADKINNMFGLNITVKREESEVQNVAVDPLRNKQANPRTA